MQSVILGGYDSYATWGLLLKENPEISPPEVQTYYVEIPGMDGRLELMKRLAGGVRYKDRTIKMKFFSCAPSAQWADLASDIMEKLHGQDVQIVMGDDTGYYYQGMISVDKMEKGRHVLTVEMTATVAPYKTAFDGGGKKL